MRYTKHYTRDEARALLPEIRSWFERLGRCREELLTYDERAQKLRGPGVDLGGDWVNEWVRTMVEVRQLFFEFSSREIEIKDLHRGLIDFPAIIEGEEVFLCWENGEEDIEFWHGLESGYAGREKIEEE